jgi:pimeloyl-ACP methyl ester carboxylesterase
LGRVVAGLLLIAAEIVAAFFIFRYLSHYLPGDDARVARGGIDEEKLVAIGGIAQFVSIRGDDPKAPVLLVVHGGPGLALSSHPEFFRAWQKHFVVVQWDQRNAGRTLPRGGAHDTSIGQLADDGIAVAEYLRKRLHTDKVTLLAYSFGTVPGVAMARRRPDLFTAYLGTGQVVDEREREAAVYARTLRAADAQTAGALRRMGPPSYPWPRLETLRAAAARSDVLEERQLRAGALGYVTSAPDYRALGDAMKLTPATGDTLRRELAAYDAHALGDSFAVPVFLLEGEEDNVAPEPLAKAYLRSIGAPFRGYVLFKGAGHDVMLTEPLAFLEQLIRIDRELRERILPRTPPSRAPAQDRAGRRGR